ncbi:spermidine coumaroyl-CoA acyltransferase-like [Malania oleifera]|uniref:spermidine coumaroyl-CoA acyltransferase-like n=1 Tax=Malania oleifera TaxID=397392 RepID=UPI0025AEBCC4|nr:spermidine coumaroyl-CoA acyltransferase-like [Malania oleifera]
MANSLQIEPFSIDKEDVVIVKPSKPTPSDVLSLSTIDNDHNLEILCQTIYVYKAANNNISSNGSVNGTDHDHPTSNHSANWQAADPACVIKEALSRVLVYYYPLAGKLKRQKSNGRLQLTCTADGVPFLVATANCELSSLQYLDGIHVEIANKFVFNMPAHPEGDDDGNHPLLLQVTKFSCGGFTIGMGVYHSVVDGFGAAQFFRAMAELASGKSEPSVKPVWERERLLARIPTVQAGTVSPDLEDFTVFKVSKATSPYLPTTDLVHECFYVNNDSIKRLKKSLITKRSTGNNEKVALEESLTTLEVLSAYVWRSRFRALKLNSDGKTILSFTVGIRRILDPTLPNGYYGNAFVSSHVVLLGRDLDKGPLSSVVRMIKESKKKACNTNYIRNSLAMLEWIREQNVVFTGDGASMVLTDWRQLGLFEEVDFGWKAVVNMIPVPWNMFGYVDLCIFMPPSNLDPSTRGGVRVFTCLPKAAMAKFREEMDALSKIGNEDHSALA